MQLRRKIALTTGALLFTAPMLTACGFEMATDRVNDIVAGTDDRSGKVEVLNAFLVADENGTARFLTTFANTLADTAVTVESVTPGEGADVTVEGFTPIDLAGNQLVNMEHLEGETIVTGDSVQTGGHVRLVVTFSNGATSKINVPVMAATDEYADLGPSGADAAGEKPAN